MSYKNILNCLLSIVSVISILWVVLFVYWNNHHIMKQPLEESAKILPLTSIEITDNLIDLGSLKTTPLFLKVFPLKISEMKVNGGNRVENYHRNS